MRPNRMHGACPLSGEPTTDRMFPLHSSCSVAPPTQNCGRMSSSAFASLIGAARTEHQSAVRKKTDCICQGFMLRFASAAGMDSRRNSPERWHGNAAWHCFCNFDVPGCWLTPSCSQAHGACRGRGGSEIATRHCFPARCWLTHSVLVVSCHGVAGPRWLRHWKPFACSSHQPYQDRPEMVKVVMAPPQRLPSWEGPSSVLAGAILQPGFHPSAPPGRELIPWRIMSNKDCIARQAIKSLQEPKMLALIRNLIKLSPQLRFRLMQIFSAFKMAAETRKIVDRQRELHRTRAYEFSHLQPTVRLFAPLVDIYIYIGVL